MGNPIVYSGWWKVVALLAISTLSILGAAFSLPNFPDLILWENRCVLVVSKRRGCQTEAPPFPGQSKSTPFSWVINVNLPPFSRVLLHIHIYIYKYYTYMSISLWFCRSFTTLF